MTQKWHLFLFLIPIFLFLILIGGCFDQCPQAENIDANILSVDRNFEITHSKYDVHLSIKNLENTTVKDIIVVVTMDSKTSWDRDNEKNVTVMIESLYPLETKERVVTFSSVRNDLKNSDFFTTVYKSSLICSLL